MLILTILVSYYEHYSHLTLFITFHRTSFKKTWTITLSVSPNKCFFVVVAKKYYYPKAIITPTFSSAHPSAASALLSCERGLRWKSHAGCETWQPWKITQRRWKHISVQKPSASRPYESLYPTWLDDFDLKCTIKEASNGEPLFENTIAAFTRSLRAETCCCLPTKILSLSGDLKTSSELYDSEHVCVCLLGGLECRGRSQKRLLTLIISPERCGVLRGYGRKSGCMCCMCG